MIDRVLLSILQLSMRSQPGSPFARARLTLGERFVDVARDSVARHSREFPASLTNEHAAHAAIAEITVAVVQDIVLAAHQYRQLHRPAQVPS